MATDFLVGGLLLGSVSVNILALGAFWVTPSLRTTANRFVINLLIVNLVSCVILAPPLLFNAVITSTSTSSQPSASTSTSASVSASSDDTTATTFADSEETTIINATIVTHVECLNKTRDGAIDCFDGREELIIVTDDIIEDEEKLSLREIRCWGLDLAAALGALSVLLVVGDTWCAVTDPLRYHSRISELKAWSLIAGTWCLGIVFGIASAFRGNYNNDSSAINQHHTITTITNDVYNTIFSYTYFIIVILLPFGMVCAMYWRIFTEARDSGQRMRQNGSSPLLQSALNLAAVSAATTTTAAASTTTTTTIINNQQQTGGLTMKIDKQITINNSVANSSGLNNDGKEANCHSHPSPVIVRTHSPKPNIVFNKLNNKHQNILLTLTKSTSDDKLHRNITARQMFADDIHLLKKSSLHAASGGIARSPAASVVVLNELRHVHSTPNLDKSQPLEALHRHQEILQLPTVNVPPKALSYMTSIRHRLSNASSLFKYREESRAARISILVVIMFMVSYLPYGILVLMQGHNEFLMASDQALLASFTVVMANLSSPFIFAYRNKRVRRGVRRLLGVDKKTNQRLKKINNFNNTFNNNSNCSNSCNTSHTHTHNNSGGGKASSNNFLTIKRTNNNSSQCKNASCKYLTPQSALTNSVNGSYLLDIEKYVSPHSSPMHAASSPLTTTTIMFDPHKKHIQIDVEDVVDDMISNNLYAEKKSILKRVCDTSRKWGCTCATTSCNSYSEQTEV